MEQFTASRAFYVISFVKRLWVRLFFPGHFWGPRGPPIRNLETRNIQVAVLSLEFESLVPCAGRTAGPPSMSGPARRPPFLGRYGSFRFSILGMGGIFPVIVTVLKRGFACLTFLGAVGSASIVSHQYRWTFYPVSQS